MSTGIHSLVGYGVSSDSDSDGEGEEGRQKTSEDGVRDGETEEKKSRNFLLESASGSSESDSEPESSEQVDPEAVAEPASLIVTEVSSAPPQPLPAPDSLNKLPPPPLGAPGVGSGVGLSSSVFANPFRERAEERLNVLQKHVPLTLEARPSQIGGRKMCIAYRRDGRCRFGSSCKFAHDSDLQTFLATESRDLNSDREVSSASHPSNRTFSHMGPDCHSGGAFLSHPSLDQEQSPGGGQGRKKRVGVNDALIPPKRALKQYAIQREREGVAPS